MITLYHSPGSCSLATLIALEASGLAYEVVEINTRRGGNLAPEYLAINAAAKVPALRLADDTILTENSAILAYIGDAVPGKNLIPPAGTLERARAHEWLRFLSSGVHIAYRSIFRPGRLSEDESAIDAIRARGRTMVQDALQIVEDRLAVRKTSFSVSETMSVCDVYLLVYWLWRFRDGVGPHPARLVHYDALVDHIAQQPPVQSILNSEGIKLPSYRDAQSRNA